MWAQFIVNTIVLSLFYYNWSAKVSVYKLNNSWIHEWKHSLNVVCINALDFLLQTIDIINKCFSNIKKFFVKQKVISK